MTAVLVGAGWALALAVVLALCAAANRGDRIARRVLGPASDEERRELALLMALEDSQVPHERRHG